MGIKMGMEIEIINKNGNEVYKILPKFNLLSSMIALRPSGSFPITCRAPILIQYCVSGWDSPAGSFVAICFFPELLDFSNDLEEMYLDSNILTKLEKIIKVESTSK